MTDTEFVMLRKALQYSQERDQHCRGNINQKQRWISSLSDDRENAIVKNGPEVWRAHQPRGGRTSLSAEPLVRPSVHNEQRGENDTMVLLKKRVDEINTTSSYY